MCERAGLDGKLLHRHPGHWITVNPKQHVPARGWRKVSSARLSTLVPGRGKAR